MSHEEGAKWNQRKEGRTIRSKGPTELTDLKGSRQRTSRWQMRRILIKLDSPPLLCSRPPIHTDKPSISSQFLHFYNTFHYKSYHIVQNEVSYHQIPYSLFLITTTRATLQLLPAFLLHHQQKELSKTRYLCITQHSDQPANTIGAALTLPRTSTFQRFIPPINTSSNSFKRHLQNG